MFNWIFDYLPLPDRVKRWLCGHGEHPSHEVIGWNGCSLMAKCNWCGFEGMLDSQGGLF